MCDFTFHRTNISLWSSIILGHLTNRTILSFRYEDVLLKIPCWMFLLFLLIRLGLPWPKKTPSLFAAMLQNGFTDGAVSPSSTLVQAEISVTCCPMRINPSCSVTSKLTLLVNIYLMELRRHSWFFEIQTFTHVEFTCRSACRKLGPSPPSHTQLTLISGLTRGTCIHWQPQGNKQAHLKHFQKSQFTEVLGQEVSGSLTGCYLCTAKGQKFSLFVDSLPTSCLHATVISSSGSLVMHIWIRAYAAPVLFAFMSLGREEEVTFAFLQQPTRDGNSRGRFIELCTQHHQWSLFYSFSPSIICFSLHTHLPTLLIMCYFIFLFNKKTPHM